MKDLENVQQYLQNNYKTNEIEKYHVVERTLCSFFFRALKRIALATAIRIAYNSCTIADRFREQKIRTFNILLYLLYDHKRMKNCRLTHVAFNLSKFTTTLPHGRTLPFKD
jgi:hypothetical protein